MIRGQNDHCIGHLTCFIQMIQNASQFIVTLFDQSHIGWNDLVTNIVALKRLGNLVLLIGPIDGLWIIQFNLMAQGGRYIFGDEHVVIGRRYNIGPMRFDIADMRAPRAFCLIHEINRARCQPRRFTVLILDVGRFIGVLKHPTRCFFAILNTRIRKISPRVHALIPFAIEISVIWGAFFIIKPIWSQTPQTIIADPNIKPTFCLTRPDHRIGC